MNSLDTTREEVFRLYGNRLRTRVCGICVIEDRLLMVRHKGIGPTDTFWCPPGGGIQFGENALDALKREFLEETGLIIEPGDLLFVNEFLQPPLHAMELFFETRIVSGDVKLGIDPEMEEGNQIIYEVKLMTMEEIKSFPQKEVHQLFSFCDSLDDIYRLSGYLKQ
ncbi:NUDIX domain-containing protein [Telluribacter sp.]|jgi:ADP-ribose pyrophosphatase YjhB (NUDIX family)|uniref:NUDIX domain-containing protein n=1 Tax=Telluribacter sp. TaxID=1978767 RepID=UPI002E11356F|nr:NUDIX domain-containing protein [Telluribacter sp.]